jgi:uroporphyrin-III C-methyltransferase / precorrin-2 dehydrogenase / sirohydrochlorin ferrochelatase
MNHRSDGFVSIVGAGPGHPDHLTQKAVRRLIEADVVLYDALVSDDVLAIASRADCIYVGKRAGRFQTPQAAIEQALVAHASRGRRVVRLKGGDPFVFGRGGEEALALQAAGVPFEIVPGVSAAIAAPALAGIPVTHRGTSSALLVINGSNENAYGALVDAIEPGAITLVAMMALGPRATLAQRLLARGWGPDTPAAIVIGASTPQMWTWKGRLDALSAVVVPSARADAPGTVVIGDVAGLDIRIADGIEELQEAVV